MRPSIEIVSALRTGTPQPQRGEPHPMLARRAAGARTRGFRVSRSMKAPMSMTRPRSVRAHVIWHFCHVLAGSTIGRNCSIGQNVMIGPQVTIGSGCKIQNNVSIYQGVVLEDDVFCGPSCVFTNVLNPRAFISRKAEFKPTLVRRGATIGANATVLAGRTIGSGMRSLPPARW